MLDAVTIGESMILLDPIEDGPLDHVTGYRQRVAGAESNFAIALSRLGLHSAWISRLGDDPFGRLVRERIEAEGVQVHASVDAEAPTGIYFKERRAPERVDVYYYRTGSAASRLTPSDLPADLFPRSRMFHFSGINLAIPGELPRATLHALALARKHDVPVSFDPNLRPRLWDIETARPVLLPMIQDLELLLTGQGEIYALLGENELPAVLRELARRRVRIAVIKRGGAGAIVASDGRVISVAPAAPIRVIDSVGAGDAFNAGFVAGQLRGLSIEDSGRLGSATGATALAGSGDYETLPDWETAMNLAGSVAVTTMEGAM
ncbi:MAG: sugar kinase [Candidatus Dormibacteria bacterium]